MENGSQRNLRAEVERLQSRLAEVEATLEAIHKGEVDAVVVEGPQGARSSPWKVRKSPTVFWPSE